ncbi:MAG: NAD(P)-binding protein [Lachnospiraceae bacterium]|nr:NAD(P)-binding protein [Lachnospiraceae bacterium]
MYDYLIVGAGLYGAVFAHEMAAAGKTCLVIDKRDHIAGNIYTENVEGINVHRYGAHIFHTSKKEIWDYVNRFAEFNNYINSPVAVYGDELYNLPFNMNTFSKMWGIKKPAEAKKIIAEQIADLNIGEPQNLEEQALSLVGRDVYEKLVKDYTEKQWGRDCRELPAFIIRRLPLRFTYDNNYFNDRYQGIPMGGYTALVEKMLDMSGIEVRTGVDFFELCGTASADTSSDVASANDSSCCKCAADSINTASVDTCVSDSVNTSSADTCASDTMSSSGVCYDFHKLAKKLVFTGPIDEYFGYRLGHLEYRTVRFETEVLDEENYQGNAVVNYTSHEVPWTRIIEHKHFEFGKQEKTVISREYSVEWKPGMEPYYPLNDANNNALYEQYHALAEAEPDVIFGGRLGQYKYYDMDKVIDAALAAVRDER